MRTKLLYLLLSSLFVSACGSGKNNITSLKQGALEASRISDDYFHRVARAAVASVKLYHYDLDSEALVRLARTDTSMFDGEWSHDILAAVYSGGFEWTARTYPVTLEGFLQGSEELRRSLEDNRPVLVDLAYGNSGETFIVTGYDSRKTDYRLIKVRTGEQITMFSEDLYTVWHEKASTERAANLRARVSSRIHGLFGSS